MITCIHSRLLFQCTSKPKHTNTLVFIGWDLTWSCYRSREFPNRRRMGWCAAALGCLETCGQGPNQSKCFYLKRPWPALRLLSQIEQVPDKANLFKPKGPTKHLHQRPKHAIEPRARILQSSAKSARYPNHAIEQQWGSKKVWQFFGVCVSSALLLT